MVQCHRIGISWSTPLLEVRILFSPPPRLTKLILSLLIAKGVLSIQKNPSARHLHIDSILSRGPSYKALYAFENGPSPFVEFHPFHSSTPLFRPRRV